MNPDWAAIREQFPALAGWTYLNSATFGQMPRCGVEAVCRHFARRDRQACSDFIEWFGDADSARVLVARLVRCLPEDIAFIPNASAAFSLLLGGIDWKPGDQVVTLRHEFPNHYHHPAWLARRGVELVETDWDGFYQAVTDRTRVVALSTVNYSTGFRPPVAEIGRFLRERGVLFYVDGTQSVGALEFDIGSVQPDMLSVHGYKWLLSPNGAAFMYVSPALRERLDPAVIGWRSDRGWRDPENLHHGVPEFAASAEKYEGGMLAFPVIYGMAAAVEMILDIGAGAIEKRVLELAQGIRQVLRDAGGDLPFDRHPHYDSQVVCARFEHADPSRIARELAARKVLVSARQGHLRVSAHFYNDETDLRRLSDALGALGLRSRTSPGTRPGSSHPAG